MTTPVFYDIHTDTLRPITQLELDLLLTQIGKLAQMRTKALEQKTKAKILAVLMEPLAPPTIPSS